MMRRLSKFCALMLAFSVLFSGISVGHAAGHHPVSKGNAAHGEQTVHSQGMALLSSPHQKADCQETTDGVGKTGTKKSKGTDGCCHIACFPSVAAKDGLDLSSHLFDAKRYLSPYDETAVSADPEGRLRPPRFSA